MNSLGIYSQLYTHTVFILKQSDSETVCGILCHNICLTSDFAVLLQCQYVTHIANIKQALLSPVSFLSQKMK